LQRRGRRVFPKNDAVELGDGGDLVTMCQLIKGLDVMQTDRLTFPELLINRFAIVSTG
jgi:hypothetical protein